MLALPQGWRVRADEDPTAALGWTTTLVPTNLSTEYSTDFFDTKQYVIHEVINL
jgi:hypothetical protein